MTPEPASDDDLTDLLERSAEQLADIADDDWDDIDDYVSRGSTIAQLKMWLTDNEITLPSAPAKKADYVALAVKALTEKRAKVLTERARAKAPKTPPRSAASVRRRTAVTPRKRKSVEEAEATSSEPSVPDSVLKESVPKKRTKSQSSRKSLGTPLINPEFLSSLTEGTSAPSERPVRAVPGSPGVSNSADALPPDTPEGRSDRSYQSPILTMSDRNPFQSGSGKKPARETSRSEWSSSNKSRRDLVKSPFRVVSSSVTRQSGRSSKEDSAKRYTSKLSESPVLPHQQASVEPRNLFSIGGSSAPRRVVRQTVVVPTAASRPSCMRYLALSLVALAIGIFITFLFPQLRVTVTYCPSNPSDPPIPGCIPCPARALCDRAGKAHCFEGLVLQNHRCVDDPEVMQLSEDMFDDASSLCSRHLGRVLCGDKGSPFLSLQDVERHLFQLYGRQARYKDALRKTMDLVRLNTTSSLHYAVDPPRVWSTQPSRPFVCAVQHWFLDHALIFATCLLAIISFMILIIRRRRHALRVKHAVVVFKEALSILKASEGPVALDHLSATTFEHCGLEPDASVWNLALDQLSRDSRINNAITFRNGVQKKGMLFSQIPLRTADNKPVLLYPTVDQR